MGRSGITAVCSPDWGVLVGSLAQRWRTEPLSLFETETVIVSSPGVGRALAQQLSAELSANGEGICAGVVWRTFEQFRRQLIEPTDHDPWRAGALRFAILDALSKLVLEPEFDLVAHHLGRRSDPGRPGRWLGAATRFADMFLDYVRDQPNLLRRWTQGSAVTVTGEALASNDLWQYRLWRTLLAATDVADPVTRIDQAIAQLSTSQVSGRVQVFAPVYASHADLDILEALGMHNDVICYLLTPPEDTGCWFAEAHSNLTATLLALACNTDRPPAPPTTRPRVDLHATYGPNRQVEVLREALCGLFEDDPSLEPRDVVVFCPDLRRYAPLLRAAFDLDPAPDAHPGHQLRVQLTASAMPDTNEVLDVLVRLLQLPDSRARASDLIDLCAAAPVAHAFGFSENDVERITDLCRSANVRWGIDAAHRARFGLDISQNTWTSGLDQLLAGLAMPADGLTWIGTALPSDAVESSDAELIGKLAEIVSRVRRFAHLTQQAMPMSAWADTLRETIDSFAPAPFGTEANDRARIEVARLVNQVGSSDQPISRVELAGLLESVLRVRPARPNYANGALLVTNLGDLTGVPHRVVCLLGAEQPPDQTPAAERRGRWWHAVTAASDRVIVVYQHRNERDGSEMPQSVLLTRLVDAMRAAGWQVDPPREHPLHAHATDNFDPAAPFSFDRRMLAGALVSQQPAAVHQTVPVPPIEFDELPLDDLVSFLQHPIAHFLSRRAGLSLNTADPYDAAIPIAPRGLDRWAIGDRILRLAASGTSLDTALQAEWRRGTVGPRELGRSVLETTAGQLDGILASAKLNTSEPPREVMIDVPVADARVVGTVLANNDTLVDLTFSRTDDKLWLTAWVRLLAASGAGVRRAVIFGSPDWVPDLTPRMTSRTLTAPAPSEAERYLHDLVELYRIGMQQPVPLPRRSAREFAVRARLRRRPATREETLSWIERSWRFSTDAAWQFYYSDADQLLAEPALGGIESSRFAELALAVYRPLIEATEVKHHE